MVIDRRTDRSGRPYDAVRKQLQAVALDGGFMNILIADDEGLVIAASSDDPANETLGVACQTFLGRSASRATVLGRSLIVRGKNLRHSVLIHPFLLLEQPVFLIARSGDFSAARQHIDRAVDGAKRILEQ